VPILFGIDGTGAQRDSVYRDSMAHSFVRLICREGKPNTLYRRGPGMGGDGPLETFWGNALVPSIDLGIRFIREQRERAPSEPVILTGYSRGAAGVVEVARRLQREHIPVRALMLFDCVDRDLHIDTMRIPTNVGVVRHVMRSPASGSRESFKNSGLISSAPTKYLPREIFFCTHGGMGGCWWPPPKATTKLRVGRHGVTQQAVRAGTLTDFVVESFPDFSTNVTYGQDRAGSFQVWDAVQPFLIEEGFVSKSESASVTATLHAAS
jgi:hypothetical protein